ncbi:MAG: hypothetical protein AAF846_01965 [Chloroflexota bacterium]
MQNTPTKTVFDVITDFLATEPSPQEIIDFYMPDDLRSRLEYLLNQNGEGMLSYTEQEELTKFLNADEMFSMLKMKMKLRIKSYPCVSNKG